MYVCICFSCIHTGTTSSRATAAAPPRTFPSTVPFHPRDARQVLGLARSLRALLLGDRPSCRRRAEPCVRARARDSARSPPARARDNPFGSVGPPVRRPIASPTRPQLPCDSTPHKESPCLRLPLRSPTLVRNLRGILSQSATADGDGGRVRVTVRKSTNSRSEAACSHSHSHSQYMQPRVSNLSGVEIYSLQSSRNPTPRGSSFNHADFFNIVGAGAKGGAAAVVAGDEEKGGADGHSP